MATPGPIIPAPLYRVRASVTFSSFTNLNITAAYLGKRMISLDYDEDFTDQIQTGTNVINSPAPYVMGTITAGLARSLPLADAFISQAQNITILGTANVRSDTSAFSSIQLVNCALIRAQPGSYAGDSGELEVILRGVYYANNTMWSL